VPNAGTQVTIWLAGPVCAIVVRASRRRGRSALEASGRRSRTRFANDRTRRPLIPSLRHEMQRQHIGSVVPRCVPGKRTPRATAHDVSAPSSAVRVQLPLGRSAPAAAARSKPGGRRSRTGCADNDRTSLRFDCLFSASKCDANTRVPSRRVARARAFRRRGRWCVSRPRGRRSRTRLRRRQNELYDCSPVPGQRRKGGTKHDATSGGAVVPSCAPAHGRSAAAAAARRNRAGGGARRVCADQ